MRKIIYDVAVSLDGFIAGPGHSIEGFTMEGEHVQDYLNRLQTYDTVIMGRNTYEIGYKFGMKAGSRAYPHMRHFIYSKSIPIDSNDQVSIVRGNWIEHVTNLKKETGSDIYLCGGGQFAGLLLQNRLVDNLILKVNPLILGEGTRLFETEHKVYKCRPLNLKNYSYGVSVHSFEIDYK